MNNTPTNGDDFLSGLDEPDSDPPKEEVVNEEEIKEEESKTQFTDLPLPTVRFSNIIARLKQDNIRCSLHHLGFCNGCVRFI